MKSILPTLILLLVFVGCKDVKHTEKAVPDGNTQMPATSTAKANEEVNWPIVHELYADSTQIGIKGKNKIEMKCVSEEDTMYTDIRLYTKVNQKWVQKQQLRWHFNLASISPPKYTDFNNDGCGDFCYTSDIAARGANDVQTLFIFDKASGTMRRVKNAEEYPNLQYNRKLKCIDAFAVYGGSTSYFLTIDADTLRPFADVTLFDGRLVVTRYNKKGTRKLIKQEASVDDFRRFKNVEPLEEYTEADYQ
jgi:hypothetical protein